MQNKPKKNKKSVKQHLITLVMLILLGAAAFVFLTPVFLSDTKAIMVDGKCFAFIRAKDMDSAEFNLLLEAKLKERYGKNVQIKEKVELKPAHAAKKNISVNVDAVIGNLCNNLTFKGECGAIVINGKTEALLGSTQEAEQVIKDVLAKYTPEDDENVIGVEFADDVKVEAVFEDDDMVLSAVQAAEKLTQTEEKTYDYTVKSGDSFNAIATRFGMKEEELMALNPQINDSNKTLLQIGQKLKVKTQVPIYGVYTVTREKVNETIEIPEEEVENLKQYKTYRKVLEEGSEGKKLAAYKVYYENGVEVKREPDPDNDEIIKAAVPRRVEVGTLENPEEANAATGYFSYPIKNEGYFSSPFGNRNYGSGRHYGIDIAAPAGTPVYASDGGTVVTSGWNNGGYGNWVVIDHHNGFRTLYAHNSAVIVHAGENVHKGQLLSLVGSTGDSTGNHLHFEIRMNNVPRNPLDLLA